MLLVVDDDEAANVNVDLSSCALLPPNVKSEIPVVDDDDNEGVEEEEAVGVVCVMMMPMA